MGKIQCSAKHIIALLEQYKAAAWTLCPWAIQMDLTLQQHYGTLSFAWTDLSNRRNYHEQGNTSQRESYSRGRPGIW
jgi:hypothetical protein